MSVSQTGGSDLCVRHIRRKMGVDGVDGSTDVFVVYVKKWVWGQNFFVSILKSSVSARDFLLF